MWHIVINGPGYFDTAYELPEGTTTLGRADENDIVLSGDLVSRRHAALVVRGDQLTFEDQGSRNGSRVNGQAAKAALALHPGDTVVLGENTLSVRQRDGRLTAPVVARTATPVDSDVRQGIILAKSVSESFVLRALDNVFPLSREDTPSPELPGAPRPGGTGLPTQGAYDALLLISRVAELLASAETRDELLGSTMDLLMRSTGASTGVLLVRSAVEGLVPAVVRHRGKLTQGEVPISHAIVDEALAQGEALAVRDVKGDPRFNKRESVVLYGATQVLCIPLGRRRPFQGALYLNLPASDEEALEPTLDACTAVAHLLAAGVEKFSPRELPHHRVQAALSRALPPDMDGQRSGRTAGGTELERGATTVLFADLAGFSAASRKLEPRAVAALLERFYECFSQVVWGLGGAVASFVGDSALAVFGSPEARQDDGVRAVRAALALREQWRALGGEGGGCAVKAGIHTGTALSGTVATGRRADFVVVGDPVNTAAWLVGLAGQDQVLMTGKTLQGVGERFEVVNLGERTVSGRQKLAVYEVRAEVSAARPTRAGT